MIIPDQWEIVPKYHCFTKKQVTMLGLKNMYWDIGVNAIVYRYGCDSIYWYEDDTQGEK